MMVSKEKIDELKKIFKDDFGAELTDQEAHDAAFCLVGFYDTLMQCAADDIRHYINTGELFSKPSPDGKLSEHDQWIVKMAEQVKKKAESEGRPI